MYTPAGRRGSFLLVAILLVISILLEQYWIVPFLPWLSGLGGVRLMFVIFDIPVRLPMIDWAPVGLLFLFFYGVVIMPGLRRRVAAAGPGLLSQTSAGQMLRRKLWAVFGRWWILLGCLLTGGGLFYVAKEYMPKAVRNGIESFGVRADIALPYPSDETVHLEGGMIMLIFFAIGWRMLLKGAELEPVMVAKKTEPEPAKKVEADMPVRKPEPKPEPVMTAREIVAGRGRVVARIPEPVEVRRKDAAETRVTAAGKPCIHVQMPETATRKGGIRPCVVDGEIKPAVFRGERQPAALAGQFVPSTSTTS